MPNDDDDDDGDDGDNDNDDDVITVLVSVFLNPSHNAVALSDDVSESSRVDVIDDACDSINRLLLLVLALVVVMMMVLVLVVMIPQGRRHNDHSS